MKIIDAIHAVHDEPNCYLNSDCMCRESRGRAQPSCVHFRNTIRSVPDAIQINTAPTYEPSRIAEFA